MDMAEKTVVIVSPALADANNGNWQTARRWQAMLSRVHRTRIVNQWPDVFGHEDKANDVAEDDVMLALHARRSAASVQAWHSLRGSRGLVVVLTGTDLYRDIAHDQAAQASLDMAQRIVVLQPLGLDELRPAWRDKAQVVLQSVPMRQTLPKTRHHLRALMVGHLREEKSPDTYMQAARLLSFDEGILLDHVGRALEPAWEKQARHTQVECLRYRWLGELSHALTRQRIQRAHVLVHASRMEGGAHVIMEAVCSGTPVLASRVPGNVGMLGEAYEGYFEWNDPASLARLLRRCADGLYDRDPLLDRLAAQCAELAPRFAPQAEWAVLAQVLQSVDHHSS
jgi:putative glycosyltransferase (TIGR04348 family)